jgi:hypothetical protein
MAVDIAETIRAILKEKNLDYKSFETLALLRTNGIITNPSRRCAPQDERYKTSGKNVSVLQPNRNLVCHNQIIKHILVLRKSLLRKRQNA